MHVQCYFIPAAISSSAEYGIYKALIQEAVRIAIGIKVLLHPRILAKIRDWARLSSSHDAGLTT